MSNLYRADSTVVDIMTELIGQYHPDLAPINQEIAVIFREKAAKRGGQVILGKSQKAPPLIGLLGDTEYKFILELAADEWTGLSATQRQALLDHLLCSCRAVEDDEKGDIKYFIAPPDVSFFYDELDRWGDWRPRPADEDDDGKTEKVSPIEAVFGTGKKGADADDDLS